MDQIKVWLNFWTKAYNKTQLVQYWSLDILNISLFHIFSEMTLIEHSTISVSLYSLCYRSCNRSELIVFSYCFYIGLVFFEFKEIAKLWCHTKIATIN